MPGMLNHRSLLEVSRRFGASPRAVERICGQLRVKRSEKEWGVGLSLNDSSYFLGFAEDELIEDLLGLLAELKKNCPKVLTWLCRGDFNPHKIPETITNGELLHCARTASRLKAEKLRARQQTTF